MCFVITLLILIIAKRNELVHLTDYETIMLAFVSEAICVGYMIAAKITFKKDKPDG